MRSSISKTVHSGMQGGLLATEEKPEVTAKILEASFEFTSSTN
jgi:hypothetical protein